jgi:hypothetical protein
MPKVKISEYSATANSNTDVASINIDEGCAPSGINNAIRAVMGHLKDFQQGTYGDPFNGPVNGTVGATTPSTGAFTTLSTSGAFTTTGGSNVQTSWTLAEAGTRSLVLKNPTSTLNASVGTGTNHNLQVEGNIVYINTGSFGSRSIAATFDASGNLLVGTTGLGTIGSSSGSTITAIGSIYSASIDDSVFSRRSTNGTVITFRRDTTSVGSIDVTTTATSYVTSSDYRLKNTIAPMTGALAKVAALKPVTYKWNVDGSDGEGFIAHELAEVVPQCVTGEKDAVDADGNPKYQGIDTSFLVATLTAAIQEQQALITQLTARITALEGA